MPLVSLVSPHDLLTYSSTVMLKLVKRGGQCKAWIGCLFCYSTVRQQCHKRVVAVGKCAIGSTKVRLTGSVNMVGVVGGTMVAAATESPCSFVGPIRRIRPLGSDIARSLCVCDINFVVDVCNWSAAVHWHSGHVLDNKRRRRRWWFSDGNTFHHNSLQSHSLRPYLRQQKQMDIRLGHRVLFVSNVHQ
uniref:Secreted protein n=1 Tax=Echinococcus granulosus TaxID=6210 RepID=A0A068WVD5_ECHGR|nr:hypothetical protein EgrG_002031100 [Echinococcus granulosus]